MFDVFEWFEIFELHIEPFKLFKQFKLFKLPNCLFQIGHNIGYIFDSNRYAHQSVGDAVLQANFLWHCQVRGGGRMQDERVHIAQGWGERTKLNPVHAGEAGLESATKFKTQHPAEAPVHLAFGKFMVRV